MKSGDNWVTYWFINSWNEMKAFFPLVGLFIMSYLAKAKGWRGFGSWAIEIAGTNFLCSSSFKNTELSQRWNTPSRRFDWILLCSSPYWGEWGLRPRPHHRGMMAKKRWGYCQWSLLCGVFPVTCPSVEMNYSGNILWKTLMLYVNL